MKKIEPKDFEIYIKKKPTYLIKKQLKKLKYVELNKEDEKKYILQIIKSKFEKKIQKSGKNYKKNWILSTKAKLIKKRQNE